MKKTLVTLALLAGCNGAATKPDSGASNDAGRDGGVTIPCGLTDGTSCTRDAGGYGVCCDGSCVDTGSDPSNCDQCGRVCPGGAICRASTCTLGGAQATCLDGGCPMGLACAGGFYCGTLNCPAAEVGGWCALSASANQAGICCGGACVDVVFDDSNCGTCGNACSDGGFCDDRVCKPNPVCASASVGVTCRRSDTSLGACCGPNCVDFSGDTQNCGSCGSECPIAARCLDGGCVSPDGGPEVCADGGALCPISTVCLGGACFSTTCAEGARGSRCGLDGTNGPTAGLCCDGGCTDPAVDPNNCGGCGVVCRSGSCDGGCLPSMPDAGPDAGPDGG